MARTYKEIMVDFIYNNFTVKGKKIPKKTLNEYSMEELENFIAKHDCQDELKEWMERPKMIKFLVDGIENGKDYMWSCEYPNEEECRKDFENDGIKVIKIATAKDHHRCKYCQSIAKGKDKDVLCDDCRRAFGHAFYSEL